MTKLFAFQASQALHEDFDTLTEAFADGKLPATPQAAVAVRLAQRYADEIVDAVIGNLLKGADANGAAPKVLETVINIIKGTVHALIRQILSKMPNKELRSVVDYVETCRTQLLVDGKPRDFISFELSEADYALLKESWSAAARGEGDRAKVTQAMNRFGELAIEAYYDDSAEAMKLGFIARNMFSVGHAAISKGAKMAISRLVPSLSERELRDFAAYFESMLKDV